MIFGDPQNSQFCATRPGSNSVMALQLWHCTDTRSDSQPFFSSGTARNAATRSCSLTTLPSAASSIGETAPQYGQTRACCAAFQLAIAPQAGQACLSRAATSDIGGGRGGPGGGPPPGPRGGGERVGAGPGGPEGRPHLFPPL